MKRLAALFGSLMLIMLLASPAMANSTFSKFWKAEFLAGEDVDADFVKTGRKAGCYICHVKGEDKKKVHNEYGNSVKKYLQAEDFDKEWVKANPEEAKKKILAGFKNAGVHESKDGKKFGDKIKNSELPATDAGL